MALLFNGYSHVKSRASLTKRCEGPIVDDDVVHAEKSFFTDDMVAVTTGQCKIFPQSRAEAVTDVFYSRRSDSRYSARAVEAIEGLQKSPLYVCQTEGRKNCAARPDALMDGMPVIIGYGTDGASVTPLMHCTKPLPKEDRVNPLKMYIPSESSQKGRSRPKYRMKPKHYVRLQYILAVMNSIKDTPKGRFICWTEAAGNNFRKF